MITLTNSCFSEKYTYIRLMKSAIWIAYLDYNSSFLTEVFVFVFQTSTIFTSTITPLVAIGVITIQRMYPLTLGSNIGTTFTSILASLAADGDMLYITLQVSHFYHICQNVHWSVQAIRKPDQKPDQSELRPILQSE